MNVMPWTDQCVLSEIEENGPIGKDDIKKGVAITDMELAASIKRLTDQRFIDQPVKDRFMAI
tara:strand:+ start:83 stop:268 length:186 start_codon:yes stop_codon:yes gene_type:complete